VLEKTLFDINYLVTEQGIERLIDFYNLLFNYKGNYVEFNLFSQPINIQSPNTTTATAWSLDFTESSTKTVNIEYQETVPAPQGSDTAPTINIRSYTATVQINTVLRLHPNHSYGHNLNDIHLMDSYILQRRLIDKTGALVDIRIFSDRYIINCTTESSSLFVIKRATSLKNSFKTNKPKGSQPPKGDDGPDTPSGGSGTPPELIPNFGKDLKLKSLRRHKATQPKLEPKAEFVNITSVLEQAFKLRIPNSQLINFIKQLIKNKVAFNHNASRVYSYNY